MSYTFATPTWISGERNGGLPGILAVANTHGRIRPSLKNPLQFSWRCNNILSNGKQCPNKAKGLLEMTDGCTCCFDENNRPLSSCRKGPRKFGRWLTPPSGCTCICPTQAMELYKDLTPAIVWARHKVEVLSTSGMKQAKAGFQVINKELSLNERARAGKQRLMNAVRNRRHYKKQNDPKMTTPEEAPLDQDLSAEELKEERRERKRRKFTHQGNQLKNDKLFAPLRKALRPMQLSREMGIPKSQIQDDFILFQTPTQREMIANCQELSVDNLHKDSPSCASRAIGFEAKITELEESKGRGKKRKRVGEWFHAGSALCSAKDSELHSSIFRFVFEKTKHENGENALDDIEDINTDFERGIFDPLAKELNSQKQLHLKKVKPAKTNLCSGHYSGNLNKKNQTVGGMSWYSRKSDDYDENYRKCIRELRALFVMPPELMESQALKIRKKAQNLFNDGRNGDGRKGTKMAAFSKVYDLAKKYRDGTNATAEQLSTYARMQNRSNQPNEGGNAFRNFVGRDVVRQGAKPTMTSWVQQQRLLENEAAGRWKEIYEEGENYKPKNKQCVKLDNLLLHYVRQHKRGALTNDTYFNKCVLAIEKAWSPYEDN